MAGVSIYETPILPGWIDYNGHVRDAYYGVIVSSACDALMDRVGLDAAYRARTDCTLYTLEMHLHFLNEVKSTERVAVAVSILGADSKRLHAGFTLTTAPAAPVAATVEMMLLHVHQGARPGSRSLSVRGGIAHRRPRRRLSRRRLRPRLARAGAAPGGRAGA